MITDTDPAEMPQAATVADPTSRLLTVVCPACEHEVDAICPGCGRQLEHEGETERTLARDLRRLLSILEEARNSKYMLGCLLIATGEGFADGISMTEYARKWGVTRAKVSKDCRAICRDLNIQPSRYMMSDHAANGHRLSNGRPTQRL